MYSSQGNLHIEGLVGELSVGSFQKEWKSIEFTNYKAKDTSFVSEEVTDKSL